MIRKVLCGGHCMGPGFAPCLLTVDDEAEIVSGDLVLAHFRVGDEVFLIAKQLETWDGKWYLWARSGVTLLAGHQLVLAHLERVTHVAKLPDNSLGHGKAHSPSLEELAVQDSFTREARKGWNEHGFPRGVKFPGLDAIYPYRGPEVRLIEAHRSRRASATIPTSNPTTPTEAQNLSIKSLAGTLYFDWDPPVVKPTGTRYRVIGATNCSNASVGTIAWTGDADAALLGWTDTRTRWWWWIQTFVESHNGPYLPNTFGTLAAPSLAPNAVGWPIPDPQLRAGPFVGSYWWQAAGAAHPLSIVSSGGLDTNTGRIIITGSSDMDAFTFGPDRRGVPGVVPPFSSKGGFEVSPGQTLTWTTAFRRTTSVAGSAGFNVFLNVYGTAGLVTLVSQFCRVDTLALNDWAYLSGTVVVPSSRYVSAEFFAQTAIITSGTIEIGLMDVTVT